MNHTLRQEVEQLRVFIIRWRAPIENVQHEDEQKIVKENSNFSKMLENDRYLAIEMHTKIGNRYFAVVLNFILNDI